MKHDPFRHAGTLLVSEYGHHFSVRFVFVSENPNGYDFVVFRSERVAISHEYVFSAETLDYLDESIGALRSFDVSPDQYLLGAFHELNYFRFSLLPVCTLFGNLNLHCIAVERSVSFAFSDEKNLSLESFDESEVRLNLGIYSGMIRGVHGFF